MTEAKRKAIADRYRRFFERIEADPEYYRDLAATDFTVELEARMVDQGIDRAEMARRLGCSRAHVTQVLRADANLTLETMVSFARMTGGVVRIHVANRDCWTKWIDRPKKGRTGGGRSKPAGREGASRPKAMPKRSAARAKAVGRR